MHRHRAAQYCRARRQAHTTIEQLPVLNSGCPLVFVEPGDGLISRFGHSAIWIEDTQTGITTGYNYGISDSHQPGFWRQLVRGRIESRMRAALSHEAALFGYVQANRSVWIQELNLLPAQRPRLLDMLELDERSDASRFTYEFYRDNCTTAIRGALDWVLDGQIFEGDGGDLDQSDVSVSHPAPHGV
jgi:hypothetical protein